MASQARQRSKIRGTPLYGADRKEVEAGMIFRMMQKAIA
jgi:hypothetical protein